MNKRQEVSKKVVQGLGSSQDVIYILGYFPLFYPDPKQIEVTNQSQVKSFFDSLDIPDYETMGCIWAYAEKCLQPIIICKNAQDLADHMKYYSDNDISGWFEWYTKYEDDHYTIGLLPKLNKVVERYKIRHNYIGDANFNLLFRPLEVSCASSDHYDKFRKTAKTVKFSLIDYDHAHKYKTLEEIKEEHFYVLGEISRTEKAIENGLSSQRENQN